MTSKPNKSSKMITPCRRLGLSRHTPKSLPVLPAIDGNRSIVSLSTTTPTTVPLKTLPSSLKSGKMGLGIRKRLLIRKRLSFHTGSIDIPPEPDRKPIDCPEMVSDEMLDELEIKLEQKRKELEIYQNHEKEVSTLRTLIQQWRTGSEQAFDLLKTSLGIDSSETVLQHLNLPIDLFDK